MSNSNPAQIIAFPFPEGGEPRVVADVGCDDFAFDREQNLYCGTNAFNTMLRVSPEMQSHPPGPVAEGAVLKVLFEAPS